MNPLDIALKRYKIEDNKYYSSLALYDIMSELGLIRMKPYNFARDWIRRRRLEGTLVIPEKVGSRQWKLTGKMIRDIVYAFAPGGSGRYDYKEAENYASHS